MNLDKFTNKNNIHQSIAVWLLHNTYDFVPEKNSISATTLLNSTKQIILSNRSTQQQDLTDLYFASRGTAIHTAIEQAWKDYIASNPDLKDKIYLEHRTDKVINNYTISGKFDMVINGTLFDNKTTSVNTYIFKSKINDYIKQCSIYAWLNPDIITNTKEFCINYLFTDWKESQIETLNYPQSPILTETYELMSYADTEQMIKDKINQIEQYKNANEEDMPECNEEELWVSKGVFKYYSSGVITPRCTRKFDTEAEAIKYKTSKGNKGLIVYEQGMPKKCAYCKAYNICNQRKRYFSD